MKIFRLIACVVFIMNVAVACSGASSKADQAIKADFKRYLTQISQIGDIEVEAGEANKKAVEAPNSNDATYALALKDTIIPKYEEFQRELGRIHPMTNEILGLHRILINRVGCLVSGFGELERAARTGDDAAIKKVNALFEDCKVYFQQWSQQVDDLGNQYSNDK